MAKKNRVGEIGCTNKGDKMEIVSYNNRLDIDVRFEDGCIIKKVQYGNFKDGKVSNPYARSLFGVGFIGQGDYTSKTHHYEKWSSMIKRCYSDEYHKNKPAYSACSTVDEWHNYQIFANWYDENYYHVGNNEVMTLDKDILVKGNKIYSPDRCLIVPQTINLLFIGQPKETGLPIGVLYTENGQKYKACCRRFGENIYLGIYNTSDEAFHAYKEYKENFIKEVALLYRDRVPEAVFMALMNYKI